MESPTDPFTHTQFGYDGAHIHIFWGTDNGEVNGNEKCLFPLDRGRWFGRDVIDDAVDALDFVDDAA